jgi:hypothetical protein
LPFRNTFSPGLTALLVLCWFFDISDNILSEFTAVLIFAYFLISTPGKPQNTYKKEQSGRAAAIK